MLVLNKWNKKKYKVINKTDKADKAVTLEREDGSQFTINKQEYFSNYSEKVLTK